MSVDYTFFFNYLEKKIDNIDKLLEVTRNDIRTIVGEDNLEDFFSKQKDLISIYKDHSSSETESENASDASDVQLNSSADQPKVIKQKKVS